MTAKSDKPITRNRSAEITVSGEFAGQPQDYDVMHEEWLNKKTNRYHRVWWARQVGSWGWHSGGTARLALMNAACERGNRRPRWASKAGAEAEGLLS